MEDLSIKNQFMRGPGNYLASKIKDEIRVYRQILAVVLLIDSPSSYKTLYIFDDDAVSPEKQAEGLERLVNEGASPHHIGEEQLLPGGWRYKSYRKDKTVIRSIASQYVVDVRYQIIPRAPEANMKFIERIINPPPK